MSISMKVRATVNGKPMRAFFRRFRSRITREKAEGLAEAAELALEEAAGLARREFTGSGLHSRTGALRRSIGSRTRSGIFKIRLRQRGRSVTILGEIGSQLAYAAAQEFGATITPTKAQWLTIPLDAAKTAAGVPRGGARSFSNTFFLTSTRGNLLLVQRDESAEDGFIPLFVLKKRVQLPARPYLGPAVRMAGKRLEKLVGDALEGAIEEAGR